MAKARSDLRLGGHLVQPSYLPGIDNDHRARTDPVRCAGRARQADPTVRVTRPDNVNRTVSLTPNGGTGVAKGAYGDTPLVGPYLVAAEATATFAVRVPFGPRYRQLTGLIFRALKDDGHGGTGAGNDDDGGSAFSQSGAAGRSSVRCATSSRQSRSAANGGATEFDSLLTATASRAAMISPMASCSVRKPSWPTIEWITSTPCSRRDQLGELVLEPQRVEPVGRDARRSSRPRVMRPSARRDSRRGRARRRGGSSRATARCRCWRRSGARASRRGTRGTTRPCTGRPRTDARRSGGRG